MEDKRVDYLSGVIAELTGSNADDINRQMNSSSVLKDFLDDTSIPSIKCTIFDEEKIKIETELSISSFDEKGKYHILFVKRNKTPLNPDNISSILDVFSLKGSPIDSLYSSLKSVWCPALLTSDGKLSSKVQQLLTDLELALSHSVKSGENSNGGEIDVNNLSEITEPADEVNFWMRVVDDRRSPYKTLAGQVDKAFCDISKGFSDLPSYETAEMEDLIERSLDALNEVWMSGSGQGNKQYPQNRMQHLFSCMGGAICRYLQKKLSSCGLWTEPSAIVRTKLQAAIQICEQWCSVPRRLTSAFWPNSEHPWKGPTHEDAFTVAFKGRLESIQNIRTLAEEFSELLSNEERKSFQIQKLFEPLDAAKPLLFNPYTEAVWTEAVQHYQRSVDPVESAVTSHLKRKISAIADHSQLLLREFQRYRNLLDRPTIRRLLASEREALLVMLRDQVKNIEASVDGLDGAGDDSDDDNYRSGKQGSSKVGEIVSLCQLGAKTLAISNSSAPVLNDLPGYSKFSDTCVVLISRIKSEQESRFKTWVADMEERFESEDGGMRLSGSLMGWKEGLLVVNFSEELVTFLRELRQLDELGFEVPKGSSRKKGLAERALESEKYYRYGILLKKTANFYNGMSEQMVDVQEQLLLESLSAFATLVSKPSLTRSGAEVTWANPAECENYIRALQEAAEKLSSENRWLRKMHEGLISQTVVLMGMDLLRQTDLWKARWRTMKERMQVVRGKYSEKDARSWVLHCDHQMYKALEASYQMGLESLNDYLPEIKADLTFANKRLDFKPPLEQIRQTYYTEMRKFAAMPSSFDGFGSLNVYRPMGVRNTKRLLDVFKKAETLFEKLSALIDSYESWTYLGQIDIDQYIEANVSTTEEFANNFKVMRSKRRDIDKLPDSERIGCCTISFTPFKSYLEDLFSRISDSLLVALRRSLLIEFKEVDSYLESSLEKLSTRPHTVEEIGNARKVYKEIDEKKEEMKLISKLCQEKKKLLLQYAPGSGIDTSEIASRMVNLDGEGGRWDDFDIALEAYNDMVEEQKEALKGTLEEEAATLNANIDRFGSRWRQLKPTEVKSWEYAEVLKIFDVLTDWKKQFAELQQATDTLTDSCLLFGLAKPRFNGLDTLSVELAETNKSWDMLKTYYDEYKVIADQDWLSFSTNVYVLQDFAVKWVETLKVSFAKGSYDSIADHIITTVEKIKKSVPALKYCRGEPFKEDHWTELLQGKLQLSRDVRRENVKVEHFLSRLDILMEPATLSFVKNLNSRALGEVQIREALQELKAWERSAEVTILTQEDSGRKIPLIKEWKDLFLEMGDKQSLLSSLKESQYFKAFADQGLALEVKLATLDFVLHTLNSIQRKWVYLEPLFGRGALPSEESRFKRVDEELTDIMTITVRDPKLFSFADEQIFPHLSDKLRTMLDQLERCQKALADFLEAKRSSMPRFYFIGDDDLLEILGQAKKPAVIQSHLKKLFQGIHKVKFNEDCTRITAMVSSSGEEVALENAVIVSEKVEDWLELLAQEMRSTLSSLLVKCLKSKSFDWNFPSQTLCLAAQIRFTDEAEAAIEEGGSALKKLRDTLNNNLRGYTSQDLSGEPLLQLKMKSLVLDVVHQIDVVDLLIKKKITRLSDWTWHKQLRYYHEKSKAIVRMCDAEFEYTHEYQGNAPKLVHTPLTDKCYLTLTQGMHMGFGGNPYGPAGTGKTESVKALASCMGRQVLVFNCDEGIDFLSMGRIFIGLIKCGAWGCFDEFNRLKEDQLSAISQQIQVIQDAIKQRTPSVHLLGRNVNVDFNAGIFVTLNPAGKGYGGRSRLPDNLKALFRPVAMGAPDNELIAEVNLVTEGFSQAKDLASKIVSLFKLSQQLLSPQQHYDWGLRALKAVLNSGGRLIQGMKVAGSPITPEVEYEILIKAVRVNTLSKLTYADTSKFLSLVSDVFPGAKSSDISGGELEAAILEVMKEKPFFLLKDAAQVKKMIQLKESLDQRMGCIIVGPSGCGKSSLWRVLKAAMIKCGQAVVTHVMNPKSMPRERPLGRMDLDTREWFDGVLTDAARKVVREPQEVSSWIICDGDVDPEWIESLNSVLDDNHLLTLPNGERISFGSNVNFLFETHDLKFASPATVSRMGMIFLSDEDLDVTRIVQRWLSIFPQEHKLLMSSWLDELFYKALEYVVRLDGYVLDTTLVGTVMNGLSQVKPAKSKQEFICGLIRGLGGNLSLSQRAQFAKDVFQWANERPPDVGAPLDCYADGSSLTSFVPSHLSSQETLEIKDLGEGVVIPTVAVQRTMAVLEPWIAQMEPFILVGPEGCGKSMIINHAFRQKRNISIATLHCNAQTSADDIINKINQTCSLYSSTEGRVYRPRDCERLVLYLKDINLPRPDMYDTCQLIAFLQQLITFDGFYDEALEFLRLERIQIVASVNAATTVGRHALSTRFTAVVRVYVMDYPETIELSNVYEAFLNSVLNHVKVGDAKWVQPSERQKLASAIVEVYQKVREKCTVDDRRHYLFTPRDVTCLVKNLCRYDLLAEPLLEVVAYEACRIFRDRLVGTDACSRFDQQLSAIIRSSFRHTVSSIDATFTSLTSARGGGGKKAEGKEGEEDQADLVGGKLSRMAEADLKKLVAQGVMYYEREERDLGMLLFPEILEHATHVDRVLSSYAGHLLLVGRCGVGRRNVVTIVSYMLGYEVHSPSPSRDYGAKQFCADMKIVMAIAGVRGEHVVLYIEDFQVTSEHILELINSLLSSGEVPGLYSNEELEPLLMPLKEKFREEGSHRTPYEFFVSRVRKYLHVALSMDPTHPSFLYRCESNPALYTQCSILWMGEWRTASLRAIPTLMEGVKELISPKSEGKDDHSDDEGEGKGGEAKHDGSRIVEMVLSIHESCIDGGASPRDFLALLTAWYSLLSAKKVELSRELGHLEAGLHKLDSASEIVNDLSTNAAQQEKELKVAQAAADRAMDEISKAITNSNERKKEVIDIKAVVAENEKATLVRKNAIENELAEIQPILDSAKEAVGGIKSEHLNEIRSLNAPPEAIADVLAGVLMLLNIQDLSWSSMRKFLGNRGVKEDILNFDAKNINDDVRKNVSKLIKKKASSFEAANIQRVSVAAAPMAAWVKANIKYSLVIEKIEPLQQELDEEVTKLEKSQKRLKRCEDELRELDERYEQLKAEFGNRTAEAERLKRNLAIAGTTLVKAQGLIGQLGGEQKRWKVQAQSLRDDVDKLPVKMLLAAGFTTYLAKTPEDTRSDKIAQWQQFTGVTAFSFRKTLSTESELLQWKVMGLPADDLSQENGITIINSKDRVPFIIDPASACTDWLRSVLSADKSRPLEVVIQHDSRFINQVELAVRFGKTLVILEADGVEPLLFPLCRKDLCHQGARNVVAVGDKFIDYNELFRLYLVTRNPQPDLRPDAMGLVNQINFTVTRSGLEGQLLGLAIQHEQPELEKAKGELLRREEDFQVQLAALEKNLLQTLATAEGNLLENTELIESLSKTKSKSAEIEEALALSAEASLKLNQQREVYRSFARAGSKLFFLVKATQLINHMYQFSLASFVDLFKQALAAPSQEKSSEDRLAYLVFDLEVRVLYFIGRAMFKADRPLLAIHLVKGMHKDHFQPKEWEIFIGSLVSAVSEGVPKGYPSWAPTERQSAFRLLLEHMPHVVHSLELENTSKWQRFASSLEAERDIPSLKGISPFQKVLIVQAFRPDRLMSAVMQFCCDLLRVDSIYPAPLALSGLLQESSSESPILLISSPGADASKELQEFAFKTVGANQYEEIAMGGGQQEVAVHMLRTAAAAGSWLCLKNLHLVVAWLPQLEKELSSLERHKDFRLWLTSESHGSFPSILLQHSLKSTYESPPGIKKNIQATFDSWDGQNFDSSNPLRNRLLFLLACFHAIMQERRVYIPQGWTKFYEFSYGDLKAGTFVIEAITASKPKLAAGSIDWETIHGLMEDAIYGGRIDNPMDLRVLRSYLNVFFSDRIASDKGNGEEVINGTPLRMPSNSEIESFKKVIAQLHDTDAPFIFSLPDNIERSLQRSTSTVIIKQLRTLSALSSDVSKFDKEKWKVQLSPLLDLWQLLTSSGGILKVKTDKDASKSSQDSVADFIWMENEIAADMCTLVDNSLRDLKKVLFSTGLLTPAIQNISSALLSDAIPVEWTKKWEYGPEKPLTWLRELVRKRVALLKWKSSALKSTLLDEPLSLRDLFNPGTFMNALRQQTARKLGAAIDRVKLVSSWDKDAKRLKKQCPMTAQLTNLLLQGASFTAGVLREAPSDASELSLSPNVTIGYVLDENEEAKEDDVLSVPVYLNPSRESLLTSLDMPVSSSEDISRWILAGVALFLSEDD